MSNEVKQEDAIRARKLIESIFQNRGWTNDQLTVAIADLLATVRREEREAAFKEASRIIDNLSTRRTDNSDRYVTASAFQTRASCALERAALEASANQRGEVNG